MIPIKSYEKVLLTMSQTCTATKTDILALLYFANVSNIFDESAASLSRYECPAGHWSRH